MNSLDVVAISIQVGSVERGDEQRGEQEDTCACYRREHCVNSSLKKQLIHIEAMSMSVGIEVKLNCVNGSSGWGACGRVRPLLRRRLRSSRRIGNVGNVTKEARGARCTKSGGRGEQSSRTLRSRGGRRACNVLQRLVHLHRTKPRLNQRYSHETRF